MKEGQTYPPGYLHEYVTLREGSNAVSFPVVEADPNILLDDEDGVQARSLASPYDCTILSINTTGCFITYCWKGYMGVLYTEVLTLRAATGIPIRRTCQVLMPQIFH